jgi:hypothetical protein
MAQIAPTTILEIEVENIVGYNSDVFDASKFATDPSPTTLQGGGARNFALAIAVGDIVAVNGKPAKGNLVFRGQTVILSPAPTPGQAVADIVRTAVSEYLFEIQQADGTPVGTFTLWACRAEPPRLARRRAAVTSRLPAEREHFWV